MSFNLDDYEPVSARLARWLEATDGHTAVITEMVHRGDDWCIFKAGLYVDGTLVATGWAEEHVTERGVNSTSHVENCETSAVGRALANAGFAGSDPTKRPSREEMTKVQSYGGQPAQYGNKPATIENLEVVKVVPEENLIMVRGAIPGHRNSLLLVRSAAKKWKRG